jgi:non-heme chloroperoxidase
MNQYGSAKYVSKRSWIPSLATICVFSTLFVSGVLPAAPATGSARDIRGVWQGALVVNTQVIHIVFRLRTDRAGQRQELNIIEQGPASIPVSGVTQDGDKVELSVVAIHGSYKGKLSRDGATLEGNWTVGPTVPLVLHRATPSTAWKLDPSPHTVHFVTVDHDVKLEVLDWGGTGRPLVLLTGLGENAHTYDQFAPKLAASYHVVGITRRGFGASSVPATGYSPDRLGDDVLEVVAALKLSRPVMVGHSIAGEELSDIGVRHPEKVAGLIYLDAGYWYAFYNPATPNLVIDQNDVRTKLDALSGNHSEVVDVKELANTDLPRLTKELQEVAKEHPTARPGDAVLFYNGAPAPIALSEIARQWRRFTAIESVPILAVFADPHAPDLGMSENMDSAARAALEAQDYARTETQVAAFEHAMPAARVVRLAHADHVVYRSNEADVLREINAFIAKLPPVEVSK